MNRKVPAFHPSIPPAFIENHKIVTAGSVFYFLLVARPMYKNTHDDRG
jgi:hypothetical protein